MLSFTRPERIALSYEFFTVLHGANPPKRRGVVLVIASMSERPRLSEDKVSDEVKSLVGSFHRNVVDEVATTVARDKIVVVGMAQNPFVKKARKLLESRGVKFTYLEYGSYLSQWKERLALKIWAGFPTFPMVFIDGVLVGGNAELVALDAAGKLPK